MRSTLLSLAVVVSLAEALSDVEQQEVVGWHNLLRAEYGACNLEWDAGLAADAAATDIITMCQTGVTVDREVVATYGGAASVGPLLSFLGAKEGAYLAAAGDADWYDFAKLIWRSSTKVGCAMCSTGGTSHLVCHYDGTGSEANIFTEAGAKGDLDCCSQPDGTDCDVDSKCQSGYCSLYTPGCRAIGTYIGCFYHPDCDWVDRLPPFCNLGGCTHANCAVLSPDQRAAGFTCDDCVMNAGLLLCGVVGSRPLKGLCQDKASPIYHTPHMWEPAPDVWPRFLEIVNAKRAERGMCPMQWDSGLAATCSAEGIDANGNCAAGTPSYSDNYDVLWQQHVPFAWGSDADIDGMVGSVVYHTGPGAGMLVDDAEAVACCLCNEEIVGQVTIMSFTCKVRKGGGALPVQADVDAMSSVGSPQQQCGLCAGLVCIPPMCKKGGVCDPSTGVCSFENVNDGTPCIAGTSPGECSSGACEGIVMGGGGARCPAVAATYDGTALLRSPLAAADLTQDHTEPMEVGYLKDFSTVTAVGAVDGEVLRLADNTVHKDEELRFECPVGCSEECEVYVVAYHCPACPGTVGNGVIGAAMAAGWEIASCAPQLHAGLDDSAPRPMLTMRKVLGSGAVAVFPSPGDVNYVMALAFRRELVDCEQLDAAACASHSDCVYHKGQCSTSEWCPRRFSRGPFTASASPGCAANCLV